MKKAYLIILAVLISGIISTTKGQQIPQYSQFMFNPYIINPAVAGTYNYFQIRSNNRYQWIGIPDAPQTYSLSVYGPHAKKDMGFGGMIISDITGPTSRLGLNGSYAYNIRMTDDIRVSGGLMFGLMQYKVDGSKLNFGDANISNDPALFTATKSILTPDASIGFYMYSSYFYAGLSAMQLFGNKVNFNADAVGVNKLKQHFILSGGYKFLLNRYYELEPSAIIKYMSPAPMVLELNGKLTYRNKVWGGLSVRWKDAASILIGYTHENKYIFGYSYDYSFTSLSKYNSGTHEIMIGVLFEKIK